MTVWLDPPAAPPKSATTLWAWWQSLTLSAVPTASQFSRSGPPPVPPSASRAGLDSSVRRSSRSAVTPPSHDVDWGARWLPSQPAVVPPLHKGELPERRVAPLSPPGPRERRAAWRADRRIRDCGSPYRIERRASAADRRES